MDTLQNENLNTTLYTEWNSNTTFVKARPSAKKSDDQSVPVTNQELDRTDTQTIRPTIDDVVDSLTHHLQLVQQRLGNISLQREMLQLRINSLQTRTARLQLEEKRLQRHQAEVSRRKPEKKEHSRHDAFHGKSTLVCDQPHSDLKSSSYPSPIGRFCRNSVTRKASHKKTRPNLTMISKNGTISEVQAFAQPIKLQLPKDLISVPTHTRKDRSKVSKSVSRRLKNLIHKKFRFQRNK